MGLREVVTRLVLRSSQRVSRAARKLWSGPASLSRRHRALPFLDGDGKRRVAAVTVEEEEKEEEEEEEKQEEEAGEGEGEVWRRTILMGEKCQPLDYPGVIYYDVDGRQLSEVPPPRTPLRSPLRGKLTEANAESPMFKIP